MPVYKSNEPTKDGRKWFFKCQYRDAYGETHTKKSKKFESKTQACDEERRFLLNCGEKKSDKVIWDDLIEEFLENSNNKDGTLYSKKISLNKYGSIFKNKDISYITPPIIDQWKKEVDKYNLATSSKQNIFNYFKTVLDYAIKKHYIDINPFRITENFQKDPNKIEIANEEELYLTPDEFNKFISVIDNEFWKCFFSFAFYMGTRKGEQIALQWKDINFENHTIKIYKQLNLKGLKKTSLFIPTKNSITRTISVPNKLWDMIISKYEKDTKIIGFNENFYVFGDKSYTSFTTIDRKKDYYFNLSGVKRITMHQFRHSHASLLISCNIPLNVIAARLGDTPDIVLKTYAHLFPQKEAEVLNVLNNF